MKCIDKIEFEGFLAGKLESGRLVEISEHLMACAGCKSTFVAASCRTNAAVKLQQEVLGIADCPEYEEISAYVDQSLNVEQTRALLAHINACELCARDVNRIKELRSQASLRGTITVSPGASRVRTSNPFNVWQRALGAAVAASIVVAAAFSLGLFGKPPSGNVQVASNPAVSTNKTHNTAPSGNSNIASAKPTSKPDAKVVATAPIYKVVLRDGRYQVIEKNGKMMLAKSDGSPAKTGIAAKITEKLATGSIRPAEHLAISMRAIRLRGSEGYVPPPTAPKLVSPVGKIILSQQPCFKWSAVELAHSYQVVIRDERGNTVFQTTTTNSSMALSARLERGHVYSWQVGSRFNADDFWGYSAPAKFKVLSDENFASISQVKRKVAGSHLALAVAYESCGLYDEAAREYQYLRRANRSSKLAHKLAVP